MKTPGLQVALDMTNLDAAVSVASRLVDRVDVVEAGTVLCLAEGMAAVRKLRAALPEKTILADIRIVRAGEKLAAMAFDAGANWVTVVAEAPRATVIAATTVARARGGVVQIELADTFDVEDAKFWRELGLTHVITHNTSEIGEIGGKWSEAALKDVADLASMGFAVSVTGGIEPSTIPTFKGLPIHIFIAGRGIWGAKDPAAAATSYRAAMNQMGQP
jgi:3-keto-L-gulonate-6-phosphate decarboxylase